MPWSDGDFATPKNLNNMGATPTIFNVKAYGAKGDGTTDDAASIQSAVSTAAVNGGTVFFPSSQSEVYSISTTIRVMSLLPVHLKGEMALSGYNTGDGPYFEAQANLTNGFFMYQTPSGKGRGAAGGGTVEGLAFYDSSDRSWTVGGALNLVDFDTSVVRDCQFYQLNGSAVSMDRAVQSSLEDCNIRYCGVSGDPIVRLGTDATDSTNVVQAFTMRGCRLEVNAETYVYIEDRQSAINIENCYFETDSQTSSENTYIWNKGDRVKISNCNFGRNKQPHVHFDTASAGENILADSTFAGAAVEPHVIVDGSFNKLQGLGMHGSLATQTEISITGTVNTLSDVRVSVGGNVEVTGQLCHVENLHLYDLSTSEASAFVLAAGGSAVGVRVDTTDAGVSAISLTGTAVAYGITTRNVNGASDGVTTLTNFTPNSIISSSAATFRFANIIQNTASTPFSLVTATDFNDMALGDVRLVLASSGMSLAVSSGNSLYDIGSNTSAAQPTS